jgi:histone H3/H4
MEAMERAFREDMMVWSGPNNVVFPRRYHTLMQLKNSSNGNNGGGGEGGGKKKGSSGESGSDNDKKEKEYYGSQSQGWMYGDGLARMGQLSWMDVTSPPSSSGGGSPSKRKKVDSSSCNSQQQQSSSSSSSSGFLMDDVTIIDKALQSSGLTRSNLTPRAYACLLEQARRYTLELLADAQDYALHAARDSISTLLPCDLLLAAEMREDVHGISSTLPCVEDIQGMADEVNRVPLPAIPRDCYGGVVLPPVEDQLTARTFDVVNGARVVQRMLRGGDYPMSLGDVGRGGGGGGTSSSTKRKVGSYGAGIGRQIAVNLKSSKKGEVGISGSKDVGATASPAQPAKASSSGSKGQKRKLTAL